MRANKRTSERFFKRLEDTYKRIDEHPESYQKIYKSFRAAKVKNFPFQIVYELTSKKIVVYTIFNTYRNPLKKHRK